MTNGQIVEQLRQRLNAGLEELAEHNEAPFTSQQQDLVIAKFDRAAVQVLVAAADGVEPVVDVSTHKNVATLTRGQKAARTRAKNKKARAKEAEPESTQEERFGD